MSMPNKIILPTLEFYDQLSDSFDQMMSWPLRFTVEGVFFKKLVSDYKIKSSLDVSCATGFHVVMFRRLGLDAVGIDASPKMIAKAKANSVACGVTVDFVLGDYGTLGKRFSEGFDIITFLGDTMAHIKNKAELQKIVQSFYSILNPGGFLVLHTRNYEWVLKNQIRFLPPIISRNGIDETLFLRFLDLNPKSIDFNIVRFHKHENQWSNSTLVTEIYPYNRQDIESLLKGAGFKEIAAYQNFNFDDFDKNGSELILVARKKGTLKGQSKKSVSPKKPEKTAKAESPAKSTKTAPPPKNSKTKPLPSKGAKSKKG
jgi:SAM-dependent methyltransferase